MDLLRFLSRQFLPILFASAFIGLLLPPLAEAFKPLMTLGIFGFLFGSLLRIERDAVLREMRRPLPAMLVALWIALVLPLLVLWLPSWLLPAHLALPLAIVLAAPGGTTIPRSRRLSAAA